MREHVFRRIVVGVDGREGGRDALALAGLLQRACGDEVVAVHAHPGNTARTLAEDIRTRLEAELARAGVAARPVVLADPSPARALHAIAERDAADLIVVGAPHRSGAERILGGDVAAGTLRGAPCAVAVAPLGYAAREAALHTIGAGFEDTPEARRALALARRIAVASKGTLRPYTVVTRPLPVWPGVPDSPDDKELELMALERGRATLRAALAGIGDPGAGHAIFGDPAADLARRSGHLDLLVVGSRSYGPVRSLILGSTSAWLVRHCQCPLLVLPRGVGDRSEPLTEPSAPPVPAGTR
jgi:nucleotide-binding universal stress UspA family protein